MNRAKLREYYEIEVEVNGRAYPAELHYTEGTTSWDWQIRMPDGKVLANRYTDKRDAKYPGGLITRAQETLKQYADSYDDYKQKAKSESNFIDACHRCISTTDIHFAVTDMFNHQIEDAMHDNDWSHFCSDEYSAKDMLESLSEDVLQIPDQFGFQALAVELMVQHWMEQLESIEVPPDSVDDCEIDHTFAGEYTKLGDTINITLEYKHSASDFQFSYTDKSESPENFFDRVLMEAYDEFYDNWDPFC